MTAARAPTLENLDVQLDEVRAFIALLEEERTVILGGDADLLPAIAGRKDELAQRLAARGPGLRTARADVPAALAGAMAQLRECAARAKALNEQNRTLVELRLQHVNSALAVLMGGAASDCGATYSAEGRTRSLPQARSLARA